MIIKLPTESVMISDTKAEDIPEMPVIVSNYDNGIDIIGSDGDSVYLSYEMAKDVISAIQTFIKTKKRGK